MNTDRLAVPVLVGWTFFVWLSRVRNVVSNDELSTGEMAARAGKGAKALESTLHRARRAFGRVLTLLARKRGGLA